MIFNKLVRIFKGLKNHKYYVVLDGRANSVTISKAVYQHITQKGYRSSTEVVVFKSNDKNLYCFAMREDFESLKNTKVACSQLQYNEKYHKIGFRSDLPSVTAICDSYFCPMDEKVQLLVIPRQTKYGETFYEIQRPH